MTYREGKNTIEKGAKVTYVQTFLHKTSVNNFLLWCLFTQSFYKFTCYLQQVILLWCFVIMMVAISEIYLEFLDACSVNINWAIFFFLDTLEVTSVLKVFVFISNSSLGNKFPGHFFFLEATWLMPQPSSYWNFLTFQPTKLHEVAYFFSSKEEIPLHLKSNVHNFRWNECFLVRLTKNNTAPTSRIENVWPIISLLAVLQCNLT